MVLEQSHSRQFMLCRVTVCLKRRGHSCVLLQRVLIIIVRSHHSSTVNGQPENRLIVHNHRTFAMPESGDFHPKPTPANRRRNR